VTDGVLERQFSRLRWYRARLRAMEPAEIAHRAIDAIKKAAWKSDRRGWGHFASIGDAPLRDLGFIRERLAAAYAGPAKGRITESAQRIREGHFEFLGRRWPIFRAHRAQDAAGFWLCDPIGGQLWPGADRYCFAIDYRTKGIRGDVKYVWELNRLQFLHPVAVLIAGTRSAAWAEVAFGLLDSWLETHPPYRSVNWNSGIELALRLVSLTLLVAAIEPPALDARRRTLVRRFTAAHAYWLRRYRSRYSSANNHLVLEALGLFVAGMLAPDLPGASGWSAEGRAILAQEAIRQIHPDGVGAEQSPTYQAFTMEALGLAVLLGEGLGEPFEAAVYERLACGAEFLSWILDDRGRAPQIGDDDEGRIVAQPPDREARYVASILAAVCGLTGRGDLAPPERDPHLRDALFGAPANAVARGDGLKVFESGGYTVVRDTIGTRRVRLVFDHGPLGYLALAAHGHADALALWLTLDDQPVFIDGGTYLYHGGGVIRDWLRGTVSHNTVLVADRPQSEVSGPFIWNAKARARLVQYAPWPAWSVTGEHDGYERAFGVRHVRRVERAGAGITISDRLLGARQQLPAEILFLCDPALALNVVGSSVRISREGKPYAELVAAPNFEIRIVSGDERNGRGWHSPRFGEINPAPLIALSGEMGADETRTCLRIRSPGARLSSTG
jgi:Heparinase II/III-like protein/Heparinase II/III N-terminus